jgi:copper chaperone CopZ
MNMKRLILFLLALPLLAHLSAEQAGAQLLEVKQVIYGMDCAPCARGVEASIKRLEGVQSVRISLNDGTAEIRLASENRQTLDQIRQRISDNGFTAKNAEVKLRGVIREKEGKLVIETKSGEVYVLQSPAEAKNTLEELKKTKAGTSITVAGVITETRKSPSQPWNVQVRQVLEQEQ